MYSQSLPAFPHSWYCAGLSTELPTGGVLSRRLAGEDLVLFRSEAGVVSALDAYCPHLGAHLGHGGRVEGDCIRCPFHGFHFDGSGVCVRNEYGTKAPPKARIRSWPVMERMGLLFVYHGTPGETPTWEVADESIAAWTPWRMHSWRMRGHVQEIAENGVDTGHFVHIHKYQQVRTISPMTSEGTYLTATYGITRPGIQGLTKPLEARFQIHQYGLGCARVEVSVWEESLRTRQLVLATPIDDGELELRIGMSVKVPDTLSQIHPLMVVFPRRFQAELIASSAFREYVGDVSQDIPIWSNKRYMPIPALAEGDGPVGSYRRWARQFYPRTPAEIAPTA